MTPTGEVTVGIPTCDDDPRVLALVLDALAGQPLARPPVIVDMSATDRIQHVVRGRGEGVRYVRCHDSRGVAESRNRLLALADTRYLLFLDADAVPMPGWADSMAAAFDNEDGVALVGARIVPRWPHKAPPLFTSTIGL